MPHLGGWYYLILMHYILLLDIAVLKLVCKLLWMDGQIDTVLQFRELFTCKSILWALSDMTCSGIPYPGNTLFYVSNDFSWGQSSNLNYSRTAEIPDRTGVIRRENVRNKGKKRHSTHWSAWELPENLVEVTLCAFQTEITPGDEANSQSYEVETEEGT